MSEKQYYVRLKIDWEYGVYNEDGTRVAKNKNLTDADWVSMPYEHAAGLQSYAIGPAMALIIEKSNELGLMAAGMLEFPPDMTIDPEGKPKKANKPA